MKAISTEVLVEAINSVHLLVIQGHRSPSKVKKLELLNKKVLIQMTSTRTTYISVKFFIYLTAN